MPCTAKKTAEIIIEGGNDYVVTVKSNQPRLLAQLKTIAEHQEPCDQFVDIEKIRGLVRPVGSRVSSLTSVASTSIGLQQRASFKSNAEASAQEKNIYRPIITLAPLSQRLLTLLMGFDSIGELRIVCTG